MKKADLVDFRPPDPEDLPFIFATWLKGLRYGNPTFKAMPASVYYLVYHDVVSDILVSPTTKVVIACLKDDPDTILGYSVLSEDVLHWVFVKKAWRGIGIAHDLLLTGSIRAVSHLTEQVADVLGPIYEPYPLPAKLLQFIRPEEK